MTNTVDPIIEAAKELHRTYRAADKALNGQNKHDHGWSKCPRQKYFIQRAKRDITTEVVDATDHGYEEEDEFSLGSSFIACPPFLYHGPDDFEMLTFPDIQNIAAQALAEGVDNLLRIDEDAYYTLEQLRARFFGEPTDAVKKARRDDEIRLTLWPERKYEVLAHGVR